MTDIFDALPDILLELALPQPDDQVLQILSELIIEEEANHGGGAHMSHMSHST